ncbi:MAG: glycerophosphoryl diester phosphodiesterase [Candidatus Magnetoglobus multicellularis str. Araruama]|uniref:Glycerophosphoryl diester phosphodiesterase n=1 Tax=Candidatus Magnetoglobus multicellularis str. Araruama TaxID=890399 RepID=A0A1V1PGA6_9BACT|nr:MAG: glycerophosphoryl diester phosphodiesterase [Candidatus Magnetoglobus multicellularis str. Araruama]
MVLYESILNAFNIIKKQPLPFLIGNIFFILVNILTMGLLIGPWYSSIYKMTYKVMQGETLIIDDICLGFQNFEKVFLSGLFYSILVAIGFLLFIIPGVFVSTFLLYVIPISSLQKELTIVDIFKSSYRKSINNPGYHFLLVCCLLLLNIAGLLFFYFGVLLTIPLSLITVSIVCNEQLKINFNENK